MELASLRAPRPVAPKLQAGDKRIHMILRDLEKIKNTKPKKQLKRCNHLVYYIANTLRKAEEDHLLHSTAIWVLINLFRLYPEGTKPVMLESGIPGILYDIIKQGTLSGTSRQYASELCFYLSSNHPYPTGRDLPANGGPIRDFPEVQVMNRYQGELDDVSIASDLSSVMNESPSRTRQPFVPYRINETNLAKMEAMFDEGYSGQLAASLPNHMLMSQFGFTQTKRRRGEEERPKKLRNDIAEEQSSSSDDSSEGDEEEDDHNGMGAFGRPSGLLGSTDVRKLTGKDDDDDDSSVMSTLSSGSKSQAGSDHRVAARKMSNTTKKQKTSTFLSLHDGPGKSLIQDDSWSQGSGMSFRQRKQLPGMNLGTGGAQRPNTTSFATSGLNNNSGNIQSSSHFRLGGLQRSSQYNGDEDEEGSQHSFAFKSNSQDFARHQHGVSSAPHRMVQQLRQDPQLSQTALQYNFDKSKLDQAYKAWTSPSRGSRPQTTAAPGGFAIYTGHHSFADDRSVSSTKSAGNKPNQPKFSSSFLSAQASQSMLDPFSSTYQSPQKRPMTSSDGLDINSFLSDLDPLSLNIKAVVKDTLDPKKIAEDIDRDVDENDEEDWGSDDEDNGAYGLQDSRLVEEDLRNEEHDPDANNPYVLRRRLRLRAEKLIDHNFIKKLFIKNAKMDESQNLIYRMEQLLQLLDTDQSGYVSFEKFTRLIMAVAPKHVLRADVVNFMQAQTENMNDLVDYTEFIISGKVLILTKAQYQQSLLAKEQALEKQKRRGKATDPIGSNASKEAKGAFSYRTDAPDSAIWLKRQKQFVGNASTYTWKNHLQWYQKRKAQAVIWLVRRATRALEYEGRLLEAQRFLLVKRKQAFAISYLMEVGHASLSAKDGRLDAKRRLLKKVIHARKQLLKTKEAQEFLLFSAKGALKDCAYMDRVLALKNKQLGLLDDDGKFDPSLLPVKKKSPDYGNLFKVKNLQGLATQFLRVKAKFALGHCSRQDNALQFLRNFVRKVQIQFVMKDRARRDLVLRAEAAYEFCIRQDQSLLFLMRVGSTAVKHIHRREAASDWLVARAQEGVAFLEKQTALSAYLREYGRRILKYMNAREDAFAYLNKRRGKSILFIAKKKEAEVFLRKCPQGLWDVYDRMNDAQEWLAARAKRAAEYNSVRMQAAQYLQFISSKAGVTHRKSYLAQQELMQLGLLARIQYFKVAHVNHPTLIKLVKEEKKIIRKNDIRHEKQRKNWSFSVRLKVELAETFEIIYSIYTPMHLLVKTPIQRLEYLNPAAKLSSPSKPLVPSRPSTAQGNNPLALMDRPSTAPVPSRPLAITNTATDSMNLTIANNSLVPATNTSSQAVVSTSSRRNASPVKRNLDAPVEEVNIDRETTQQYLIGKFAFRKLTNNGKVLHTDRTMIDEFFRNHDLNSSCYITMYDVYPWFHRRASKIKNFQFRVSDVLSVEERAFIQVFKRYLTDKDLFEAPVKKRKKRNDDEEISKYGGRMGQSRQYVDSDEEDEDEDEDEIDEDLLFSDLELLKNADIGRLMRYLTKKKEEQLLLAEGESTDKQDIKQITPVEEGTEEVDAPPKEDAEGSALLETALPEGTEPVAVQEEITA